MRLHRLIWVGIAVTSGPAFSAPDAQNATPRSTLIVSTNRSDGAIFPAVVQTSRTQQSRKARISGSAQALSSRTYKTVHDEPARGGQLVSGADDSTSIYDNAHNLILIVPTPNQPRKRNLKRSEP
jgi:hypothetical protein